MVKKVVFFVFLVFCVPTHSVFDYDSVALSAQRGEWQEAHAKIQPLLVTHHDSPGIVYDAGVTSYKLKQYEQAAAYFEHAAQIKNGDKVLQERALFNAATTYVALHKLEQAMSLYEQVLQQNPHHEKAKHNLEKVKEMLKQKEQEQEKDQDKDKNKDKDKSPDKQKGQQKDTQSNPNKSDKHNEKQGNQSPETGDQQHKESDQKGQQQNNQSAGADNKQRDKQQGKHDKADAQDEHKGDNKEQTDKKSGEQKNGNAQKNSSDHSHTPQKPIQEKSPSPSARAGSVSNKDTSKQKSSQDSHEALGGKQDTPEQRWLAQVLDERDGAEAQASKNLMKAVMGNQLGGTHGKKCW